MEIYTEAILAVAFKFRSDLKRAENFSLINFCNSKSKVKRPGIHLGARGMYTAASPKRSAFLINYSKLFGCSEFQLHQAGKIKKNDSFVVRGNE